MVGPGLGRYTPGAILFRQACQLLLPRRCPLCGRVLGGVPDCPDCALEWKIRTRWPGPGPHAPPPALGAAAAFFCRFSVYLYARAIDTGAALVV